MFQTNEYFMNPVNYDFRDGLGQKTHTDDFHEDIDMKHKSQDVTTPAAVAPPSSHDAPAQTTSDKRCTCGKISTRNGIQSNEHAITCPQHPANHAAHDKSMPDDKDIHHGGSILHTRSEIISDKDYNVTDDDHDL
jgi:hypothetical protein